MQKPELNVGRDTGFCLTDPEFYTKEKLGANLAYMEKIDLEMYEYHLEILKRPHEPEYQIETSNEIIARYKAGR